MDARTPRTHASLLIRLRDPADGEAWAEFHQLYGPMIRGWCRHWFPRELDDMAQEVFMRLSTCLRGFEYQPEKGRFRGYLKTVTSRLMADLKEHRLRLHAVGDDDVLSQIEAGE